MAATDLVYNTIDPVLFTPDYSFLRYTLDKSQARYDQGLDAVSRSYNNLKRNLTDPVNSQRRDQFLKDAQGQLQKIASSDLSLSENISSANNVFNPLATNSAFLYDAYHTDRVSKELSTMKTWSESDDMETRKKFDPKIYSWVENQLDILKNGNGDINNYAKMPNRSSFARVDAQDIINDELERVKGTFSKEVDGGVYVYGVENGVSFKKNYDEFARNALRNNPVYQQQLGIFGESDYEALIKQGKESGKSTDQVMSEYANSNYTSIKTTSANYLSDVKKSIEEKYKDLFAQAQSGKLSGQELAARQAEYQADVNQYTQLKSDFYKQFGPDEKSATEKKNAFVTNFLKNPKQIISNQYFDYDVNTFSNIRSSLQKSTIKPNTAYFEAFKAVNEHQRLQNDILKGIQALELQDRKVDLAEDKQAWIQNGKPISGVDLGTTGSGGTETVTTVNPDGTITTSKVPKKPELTYVGPSATDISKSLTTLNTIDTQIKLKTATSIEMLASGADGGAISLLNTMGVQRENVQTVRDFFIKQQAQLITDVSKPYKPTKDEVKALNDVYTSLFAFAKQNKEENVLQKLRENYNTKVEDIDFHGILDLAIAQYKFTDPKEINYATQWQNHKKANDDIKYLANLAQTGKNAVIAYVGSSPELKEEFKDVIIQRQGERPQLIDAEEIARRLKPNKDNFYEDINWATDPKIQLSDLDIKNISEGYINGTIKIRNFKDVGNDGFIGGRDSGAYITYNGKEIYLPYMTNIFPLDTEDLQKKFSKVNTQIKLPTISEEFKDELLTSPIWNLDGGLRDLVIKSLGSATQFSSNILESADGNNFTQVEKASDQVAIRNDMKTPKNIAPNGINVHSKSNSNGGGLAVEVTFAPAAGVKDCVSCGKTYYLPINVGQGTPDILKAYNTINDETEYNRLKNTGQKFDVYNFEAMGIKVQALPHTKGSNSSDIITTYQKRDPTTKQFIPGQFETSVNTYTTMNQPYDEFKREIYNKLIVPWLTDRINFEKQPVKQQGAANTTPMLNPFQMLNNMYK